MNLIMTIDGKNPQHSYHSIEYKTWWDEPDPTDPDHKKLYYRNPNHLNPARKDLAIQIGFPDISNGEDRQYSHNIQPLLKIEEYIEEPIYYYLVRSFKEV